VSLFFLLCGSAEAQTLKSQNPLIVPGKAAHFDFMDADVSNKRILAAHKGAGTLEVLDLQTGKILKSIPVGEAQGVAVNPEAHQYYTGNDSEHSISIVDSVSLKKTGEVKLDGPVDAITFDDKDGLIYAAEDNGKKLWVVNPKSSAVVATVSIPGEPEVLEYDPQTHRIYLNIKDKDLLVSIDPNTNKVEGSWPTAPVKSPHGLAIDKKRSQAYIAGRNGKVAAVDLKSGKILSSANIATGADQIVYDEVKQLIYSACSGGKEAGAKSFISITRATDHGLESVGEVESMKGSHTLSVDQTTHDVWVAASDKEHSLLQKFKISQ